MYAVDNHGTRILVCSCYDNAINPKITVFSHSATLWSNLAKYSDFVASVRVFVDQGNSHSPNNTDMTTHIYVEFQIENEVAETKIKELQSFFNGLVKDPVWEELRLVRLMQS